MKLTKRQKEILDFVSGFIEREGYSPSMEEIAGHFGFASLNAVYKHLEALKLRGFLSRDCNRARSIELSAARGRAARPVPLLGRIAAGRPIEALVSEDVLSVPEEFLHGRREHFVLQVQGESMIEEHIQDGDYVVVEAREQAGDGDMVVALVDDDNVTLKRFYLEGDKIRLQPSNTNLPPLMYEADRVRIQGVVVGVMRRYK